MRKILSGNNLSIKSKNRFPSTSPQLTSLDIITQKMFFLISVFILSFLAFSSRAALACVISECCDPLMSLSFAISSAFLRFGFLPAQAEPTTHHFPDTKKKTKLLKSYQLVENFCFFVMIIHKICLENKRSKFSPHHCSSAELVKRLDWEPCDFEGNDF